MKDYQWFIMVMFGLFIILLVYSIPDRRNDSDGVHRSGLSVYTDALTGCQYLSKKYADGLIPRMNGTKHVGCK